MDWMWVKWVRYGYVNRWFNASEIFIDMNEIVYLDTQDCNVHMGCGKVHYVSGDHIKELIKIKEQLNEKTNIRKSWSN